MSNRFANMIVVLLVVILILGIILTAMWGLPKYGIYRRTLRGQASLQEAEWDRQIAVEEAEAIKASASLLAEAEIIPQRSLRMRRFSSAAKVM